MMSVFRNRKKEISHYSSKFKEEVVKEYLTTDKSTGKVGMKYNVSDTSVREWVTKAGYEVCKYPFQLKEMIVKEYIRDDSMGLCDLSHKYDVSESAVMYWVHEFAEEWREDVKDTKSKI